MKAAKPTVMSSGGVDIPYKGTHTGAPYAHANQTKKSDKPNETAIVWVEGVKTDKLDILFGYEDSAKGEKAKDIIGDELFNLSLKSEVLDNGVKVHPVKKSGKKPGKKNKQDCYLVSVGFSVDKFNLYSVKCSNVKNNKAPFAKISSIPSEMLRLGKIDDLFGAMLYLVYHGPNTMSPKHKPVVTARPSRIDLAYDVPVNLADYCVYASGVKKTNTVGKNNPSRYLGDNCIFYDKKQQLAEKKGVLIVQPHMMRIEVTLPRNKVPANFPEGLLDAPNPLLKLRPYLKKKVYEYLNQNGYGYLIDLIEMTDLNTALNGLYYKKRKALLAALDAVALPDWWKPEQIWPDMVEHTINHPIVAALKGGKPQAS